MVPNAVLGSPLPVQALLSNGEATLSGGDRLAVAPSPTCGRSRRRAWLGRRPPPRVHWAHAEGFVPNLCALRLRGLDGLQPPNLAAGGILPRQGLQ